MRVNYGWGWVVRTIALHTYYLLAGGSFGEHVTGVMAEYEVMVNVCEMMTEQFCLQ